MASYWARTRTKFPGSKFGSFSSYSTFKLEVTLVQLKMAWELHSGEDMLSRVFLKYDLLLCVGPSRNWRTETVIFGTYPSLQFYVLRIDKAFPFTESSQEKMKLGAEYCW